MVTSPWVERRVCPMQAFADRAFQGRVRARRKRTEFMRAQPGEYLQACTSVARLQTLQLLAGSAWPERPEPKKARCGNPGLQVERTVRRDDTRRPLLCRSWRERLTRGADGAGPYEKAKSAAAKRLPCCAALPLHGTAMQTILAARGSGARGTCETYF